MKDEDNPLERLLGIKKGKPDPAKLKASDDDELSIDDTPAYGFDRTRKPKMMLSFRKANKTARHIPYHHILMMDETEGKFITIYTHACTITVEGEKLEPIAQRIKRGDLSYVQESPDTAPDGTRVDSIRFAIPTVE